MSYLPRKPSHRASAVWGKVEGKKRRELATSIEQTKMPDSNENLKETEEKQENTQEHKNEVKKNKRAQTKWLKWKTSKDPIYV